jgi:hypothetical protein
MNRNDNKIHNRIILTDELINSAKKSGVNFGFGDPKNRIRYYIKNGLLPNQIRKYNNGKLESYIPVYAKDRFIELENISKEKGLSLSKLKSYLKETGQLKKYQLEDKLFIKSLEQGSNSKKSYLTKKNKTIVEKRVPTNEQLPDNKFTSTSTYKTAVKLKENNIIQKGKEKSKKLENKDKIITLNAISREKIDSSVLHEGAFNNSGFKDFFADINVDEIKNKITIEQIKSNNDTPNIIPAIRPKEKKSLIISPYKLAILTILLGGLLTFSLSIFNVIDAKQFAENSESKALKVSKTIKGENVLSRLADKIRGENKQKNNDLEKNSLTENLSNSNSNVLGESDSGSTVEPYLAINIPTKFEDIQVQGLAIFDDNIEAPGSDLNLAEGTITASNVIYSIIAGDGITIDGTQDVTIRNSGVLAIGGITGNLSVGPGIQAQNGTIENTGVLSIAGQTGDIELEQGTGISVDGLSISNTGVLSFGGQTGDVQLQAGTGISVNGLTVENIDTGSVQPIFKTFNVDNTLVNATSNTDVINFVSGPGVNIIVDPLTKTLTFDSLPAESEDDIEAYIFDDDNEGTMSSGTLDLDNLDFIGILPAQYGGTGLDGSAALNGQLLIGNGTGFTLSTITQGSGITVTNAPGGITITNNLGNTIDSSEIVNNTIQPIDLQTISVPLDSQILMYDSSTNSFEWADVAGVVPGDISAVGDVVNGAAFTQTNGYDGNALYFEGSSGSLEYEVLLTAGDISADQTVMLPNNSGTLALLSDIHDPVTLLSNGYDYISLTDQQLVLSQIDLATDVTGTLEISQGGTGAVNAPGARINLGLQIGVDVQGYDANTSLLGQSIESSEITDDSILAEDLNAIAAPIDTQVLTYDATFNEFRWLSQDSLNAGTLDSLDSLDFLRSNESDNYTSGTLTFDNTTALTMSAGSTLNLNGSFFLNSTRVNTTAAELNILSGALITTDELNTLQSGIELGTETTGDYVASIIAGNGLSGDVTGEGSTPTLVVNPGNGIQIISDNVAIKPATVAGSTLTTSFSGLEVDADGISLLTGCASNEILAWNGTNWVCSEFNSLGVVTGSGVAGQVAFWNDTNEITGTNNFYWDAINSRLGIGNNNPQANIDVNGSIISNGSLTLTGLSSDSDNTVLILNSTNQVSTDEIDPRVWGTTLLDDDDIGVSVQAYNINTSILGQTIETSEITNSTILPEDLNAVDPVSSDGWVLTFDDTTDEFEWVDPTTLGTQFWTQNAGIIYPTETTDDLAVGGTNNAAPFFVSDTGAITFSSDTNLYRSAANTLRTDDDLIVGNATGLTITSGELVIGTIGLNDFGTDSGATLIGVDPTSLNYSVATVLQDVLEDLDTAIFLSGDITSIGDATDGDVFGPASTQGSSLWFYDAVGEQRGQLTVPDLSNNRTYSFPDDSGTLTVGSGTTDYVAFWSGTNTLTAEAQLDEQRGGTGIDTSASTGIPSITAGAWSVISQIPALRGGTGDNTSATTGVPYIVGGDWQYETALSVARGGTGASTILANGVLYGNGTDAIQTTAVGTNGYLLYSNNGTPDWLDQNSVNAGQLDSLDSLQFLRSDTSDNFTSGTLTLNAGTSLVIDGSWFLGATEILADANELNILNGAILTTAELNVLSGMLATTSELNILNGTTITTSELNLLTSLTGTIWTSDNDGPGTGLNADLLDGEEGSYYRNATNINAGTLGTDYFSAYADLTAEAYLDNNSDTDILTRIQSDGRYVNVTGDTMTGTLTLNANPVNDMEAATKLYVDQQDNLYNELSEMTDTNIITPTEGQILIYGASSTWDNVTMGGDATIASDGTLALNPNVVDDSELVNSLNYSGILNLTGSWQIANTQVNSSALELNILNGATITTSELNLLDNRTGTLVDSNNVGTYAVTSVTAGDGLTGGGTVGDLSINVNTGDGITVTSDAVTIDLASTKNVVLTSSYTGLEVDADGLSLLSGCLQDEVMSYNGSVWECTDLNSLGITSVGDVMGGAAFTSTGTQGTSLWFYDVDGRGQLTRADLTQDRTYTLPDASGTFAFGTGTAGYPAYWSDTNTLTTEQYLNVTRGGTGGGSFTGGGILLGNGTGAIQATAQPTDGQVLIGYTGQNPVLANISGTSNQIDVTNGAGTITLSLPQDIATTSSPTFATLNTGQGAYELYAMDQNVRATDGVQFNDVLFTPKASATGAEGRVFYDSDDNNLYVYDGIEWIDLTQQDTDTVLSESEVEAYVYDNDNNLDTIGSSWGVAFGGQEGSFDLNGTGDFIIKDNGVAFATFDDSGVFTLDLLRFDNSSIGLTADSDLMQLSANALTLNGDLSVTGTISASTDETINGIDINTGTVSDVVNLTINSGGDLTIGTIGLNDSGTSNVTSGASLIGVYPGNFLVATSGNLQLVLEELDSALDSATHSPVSLVNNGYGFVSLNEGTQVITLNSVDLTSDVTGILPSANGGTGIDTSANTGVPVINSGTWSVLSQLSPSYGGTGDDTSGTTGVPYISAGNWQYEANLSVTRGGTGVGTFTTNGILYGNGTGVLQATTQGSDGYVLYSNAGTPSWLPQSSINAGQLDGLDSTQFVRSDTDDNYTSGTLTFNDGTALDLVLGTTFNLDGTWNLSGVQVLPDAGEINILEGALLSTAELNTLVGGITLGTETNGNYVASITAGDGLSGTVTSEGSTPTLYVNTGDGVQIVTDNITLKLATAGTVISTSSYSGLEVDADGLSLISGCEDSEVLAWNGTAWACTSLDSLGITAVGDVTSGEAFTSTGSQGTSLWFYDAQGRGELTIDDLTAARTYTLPDTSGTFVFGSGSTGNISYWSAANTLTFDNDGSFYWDETNNSLGIGTTAPTDKLDVIGNIRTSTGIHIGSDIDATFISGASAGTSSNTLYIGNESILASGDIGVSVQAYDTDLLAIAGLSNVDGNIIVGSPSGWITESGDTARTTLGLGTSDSPSFTGLTVSGLTTDGPVYTSAGVLTVNSI